MLCFLPALVLLLISPAVQRNTTCSRKLGARQIVRVQHQLERFNALTHRGAPALIGEAAHRPKPVAITAAARANRLVSRISLLPFMSTATAVAQAFGEEQNAGALFRPL
jgi:hypothetical protein